MDFYHFSETSSLLSSELVSWVLKACTVHLHRSELYTLHIVLVWLLYNVSSLRIFLLNDLRFHTQQFFPAQGYGNAFWVLPICTGMKCICAPYWCSPSNVLLLHGDKIHVLGQVEEQQVPFHQSYKKNAFTVQFNHDFLTLPAIPLSCVLTQVHRNRRKCTWAWT